MLENVLKQCKSNALRPLVMVWGPNGRGGHPQKMHEKVVAKALAVKQRKGENSHPANIRSNTVASFCI